MQVIVSGHMNPFVCIVMPLVWRWSTNKVPFVGLILPFVGTRRFRGFSLVELMFTLVVIAILAGLAVPSYQQFVESSRLTSAANNILVDLTLARSEAIKRQQGQAVVCTSATGTECGDSTLPWTAGRIVFWDKDSSGNFNSSGNPAVDDIMLKVQGSLPNGISTTTTPADVALISYNGMGAPAAEFSLEITSTKLGTSRLICVKNTGRVSIRQDGASCN